MRTIKILALSAVIILPSIHTEAAEGIHVRWACYPNLACDQHVGVWGRDEDGKGSVDGGDQSARDGDNGNADAGGGQPGGSVDSGRSDRESDRGRSDQGGRGRSDRSDPCRD